MSKKNSDRVEKDSVVSHIYDPSARIRIVSVPHKDKNGRWQPFYEGVENGVRTAPMLRDELVSLDPAMDEDEFGTFVATTHPLSGGEFDWDK